MHRAAGNSGRICRVHGAPHAAPNWSCLWLLVAGVVGLLSFWLSSSLLLCLPLSSLLLPLHLSLWSTCVLVMIKSKELKTKISDTHSLILSLVWTVFHPEIGSIRGMCASTACAPMVRQSELPFRMLVRQWGCQLCYSPMVPAVQYLEGNHAEREALFSTCKGEAV